MPEPIVAGHAYRVAVDGACIMVRVFLNAGGTGVSATPVYVPNGTVLASAGQIVVEGPRHVWGFHVTVEQADQAVKTFSRLGYPNARAFAVAELVCVGRTIDQIVKPLREEPP